MKERAPYKASLQWCYPSPRFYGQAHRAIFQHSWPKLYLHNFEYPRHIDKLSGCSLRSRSSTSQNPSFNTVLPLSERRRLDPLRKGTCSGCSFLWFPEISAANLAAINRPISSYPAQLGCVPSCQNSFLRSSVIFQ